MDTLGISGLTYRVDDQLRVTAQRDCDCKVKPYGRYVEVTSHRPQGEMEWRREKRATTNTNRQTSTQTAVMADIQIERERCSVEALVLTAGFAEMATFFFTPPLQTRPY